MVSGVYPPFTVTRTSCTPPADVVAPTGVPREKRKYHSTQTMAAAPSAVTASWADVTEPPLMHLHARSCLRRLRAAPDRGLDSHGVEGPPHECEGDQEERSGQHEAQRRAALRGERHRQLDGE